MSHPVVLLADDEEDVHFICKINLELEGYTMRSAHNGAETIDMAHEAPPDIVLLDVMMPVMDGWSCLEALKSDEALHDIPVVMLTAKVNQQDQIRGLAGGADAYITKPFHPSAVLSAIRQALESPPGVRAARRNTTLRQLEMHARL